MLQPIQYANPYEMHYFSFDEEEQLTRLLNAAIMDRAIESRLIRQDEQLFADFGLSDMLARWLKMIRYGSVADVAQQFLDHRESVMYRLFS